MERILMFIKPRNKTSHSFILNQMDYNGGALTTQAEAIRNRETQYNISKRFYTLRFNGFKRIELCAAGFALRLL